MSRPRDERYQIRLARPDEAQAVQDLENAADVLFEGLDVLIMDAEPVSTDAYRTGAEEGRLWVAVDDADALVGFLLADTFDGHAHLTEVGVHPDHGRRGLGRRLIDTACDWALAQGHRCMTLTTFRRVPWNEPYYARLGFDSIPTGALTPTQRARLEQEAWAATHLDDRVFMRRELQRREWGA